MRIKISKIRVKPGRRAMIPEHIEELSKSIAEVGLLNPITVDQDHTAPVISGMALLLKTYDTELNDHTFVKRLSTMAPEEITRRGRMDFRTNNTALRYARILLEKYNGSRGEKKSRIVLRVDRFTA